MVMPALVVRFGISVFVGLFAAFGVGALATPIDQPRSGTQRGPVAATLAPEPSGLASLPGGSRPPSPVAGATDSSPLPIADPSGEPAPSFQLSGDEGPPVAFDLVPAPDPPQPVQPLPPSGTLQLATYSTWKDTGGDQSVVRPPWWNHDLPRVQPITQFDGGPFQNANCTLASGAMLAKLIFGIVTTGSQLRTLQDDQDGGTSLYDLNTALQRGWGVGFTVGALTPLQFRALIYGGAGAVLGGVYAQIPFDLRLQKNFLGGHAIYIDGFRPPGPDGPAAYYVIDPIGRPWEGYRGTWWPADIIELFAMSLGGGFMDAAWGFAGGTMPSRHPILPANAYPARSQTGGPGPGPSAGPSTGADPMPTGSIPSAPELDPGTTDPPTGTVPAGGTVQTGGGEVVADPGFCARTPLPPICPPGIVGTVTGTVGGTGPVGSPPGGPGGKPPWVKPELIWATLIATGTYQLVYEVAPLSNLDVWYWATDGSGGSIHHAPGELATLGGRQVTVATITVDPAAGYSFVASGAAQNNGGLSAVSTIVAGK